MDGAPRGRLVAGILASAWRVEPDRLDVTERELAVAAPLLLCTGGAALAWRRIRNSQLADTPPGRELEAAYRLHRLEAALRERDLVSVLTCLQAAGVQPLLVKGWALGRYYPERGIRPYGDLDFFVRSDQLGAAKGALATCTALGCDVELHSRPNFAFDRPVDELFDRAERLPIGDMEVLVPCAEDHLRLLCLHMLGHGIWRPLWLCDVAAMLEALPSGFDWESFLSGNQRYTEWVNVALQLASELLGAQIANAPPATQSVSLPGWLRPAVLKQWGVGAGASQRGPLRHSFSLRTPRLLLDELAAHWQNPIEATIDLGAPFNEMPRLPLQIAAALRRVPRLVLPQREG